MVKFLLLHQVAAMAVLQCQVTTSFQPIHINSLIPLQESSLPRKVSTCLWSITDERDSSKGPAEHSTCCPGESGQPTCRKQQQQQKQENLKILENKLPTMPLKSMDRRVFMASTAAVATSALLTGDVSPARAATTANALPLPWEANPVNKRSGVTVLDAELKAGYNVAFVTYLSRFLLNFDTNCQRYWFNGAIIPTKATAEEVEQIRYDQFAAFSASIEVGLMEYAGKDTSDNDSGPKQLLRDLVRRYGALASSSSPQQSEDEVASQQRIATSARRHISLLFSLLEKNQPTEEITKLLASVENGSIDPKNSLQLISQMKYNTSSALPLSGYERGQEPAVIFQPPQAGDDYVRAQGKARLTCTGRLLRVDVVDGGSGYVSPPKIAVSPPSAMDGVAATVKISKMAKDRIESVQILTPGSGYTEKDTIRVIVEDSHASSNDKTAPRGATFSPVLNMAIEAIDTTVPGSGYAVEKPVKVFVAPPLSPVKSRSSSRDDDLILAALAYPASRQTSFVTYRKDDDKKSLQTEEASFEAKYKLKGAKNEDEMAETGVIRGLESGGAPPPLPFWSGRSSSAELLRLLPAGVGLDYDKTTKRYALAMDTNFMNKYPAFLQQGSTRIIGTEFGPRGRAPIEKMKSLDASAYLRFCLSGATCASFVHLALTPLDVAKTKGQVSPDKYPNISTTFQVIAQEEGLSTFFAGWLPTLLGNFVSGGVLYVTTEFVRRSLTEAAGLDAMTLEVPIILAAAAVASSFGAILICPFEAVRIRTVAQPEFAPNSVDVFQKMLKEEGVGSLLNAIPIFLIKNVPYAMTKFTIFGESREATSCVNASEPFFLIIHTVLPP